jgi:hypothetical protein
MGLVGRDSRGAAGARASFLLGRIRSKQAHHDLGTVAKVEWMNPHLHFYIDVKDDSGNVTNWDFELASPNVLLMQGWTRNSLKAGDEVTVEGFLARKVFAGSTAEGEPTR